MDKLIHYMQNSFAPKVNKITKNRWVAAIQDGVMAVLPFILVGSLITMLSLINEIKPILPDLTMINSFSFGLLGLFIAFLIPYNVMEKSKIHDKKNLAGLTSIALYLMLIGPVISDDGKITFLMERFGATGMFVAIIVGLVVGIVMLAFSKFSFFGKDSSLPDFIIVWFDSLIPITLLIFVGWIFMTQTTIDLFDIVVQIFQPLSTISQSFWGAVILSFLFVFLYSFGISTWVINPITFPIMVKAIADNANMVAHGMEPTNIFTQEVFFSGWMAAGGIGFTLTLAILLLFAKSSRLKSIGRATIAPSIFNINEPLVFGAPIAFNPILMIPFWINGTLIPAIAYLVLKAGWVEIPYKAFQLWYIPYPFSTFMLNGDWKGVVLVLILAVISLLIWYPFFKVYDNQELKAEAEEA